jgi:4-aminobutyrate aminotransferase-like enzyme/Ser/Thr protein kinase RdoA (MazF antagonist)
MLFTSEQIKALVATFYHKNVTLTPLPGEIDLNYLVVTDAGEKYTLKIANAQESLDNLSFQNELIATLAAAQVAPAIPVVQAASTGEFIVSVKAPDGTPRFMRLLSWIEGRCFADVQPHSPELLEQVGALCGKMSEALQPFDHPAAHRYLKWDPSQAAWTESYLDLITDPNKKETAHYFLELFREKAQPLLSGLRKSVIYGDANDYNILIAGDPQRPYIPGVIDFGDALFSNTINELAIACAYAAMHKPDPLTAIAQVVAGFHREFPLSPLEVEALFPLIGARLLISVTCSAMNLSEHPDNEYLQISDLPAWDLLEKLRRIPATLATITLRHACGWEPCAKKEVYQQWLATAPEISSVVPVDLNSDATFWLDLGVGSETLGNYADIEDAGRLHRRIEEVFEEERNEGRPGLAGIGRYNEVRPFYTTDAYEVTGNEGPEWRTVHIGLDIFMPPGTPVSAPLDGIVHSFQDNDNDRDYGPAIILKHRISEELAFYTLHGHLSRTSLEGLKKGQLIPAGQAFCTIGPMPENGNWSPHLHFQVMMHIMDKEGDYPGVAFPRHRAVWTSLCPDPWQLLIGRLSPEITAMPAAEILDYRQQHLGKNLSVSYSKPLKMLRGWRQYLFDDTGRRYLDTVNNVAHVGHEHPRVVRAGQRQMAVLNTNTRYLHENIVQFTEELLQTFPKELEVAFIVNSGSEANELAMRLAKNYTGQQDTIVVEVGYHGNTQGCVNISSYKFDGKGGRGATPGIHVVPIPDTFRGLYRGNTQDSGLKYAAHVAQAVQQIQSEGRGPAAFICESVISCGGQIPLPPGYLAATAAHVRQAGGVLISDEVQTGCGRHGTHFWAFEEHGVVPDIVTIGKPIGNGHPLGVVVTTRAIADAFANGMEYFNTFGGNPVSCAIGREVLRVIKAEKLQENALETGTYLLQQLQELKAQYPIIGDVRGTGLFLGFELVSDLEQLTPAAMQTSYLADRMRDYGILMSTDGPFHNVLKIKPPLVFNKKDADFLIGTLGKVLKEDVMR